MKGIEIGKGGPGLRVVYPVSFKGSHSGTVEFGDEIRSIFTVARDLTGTEYVVGIKKNLAVLLFDQKAPGEENHRAFGDGTMTRRSKQR